MKNNKNPYHLTHMGLIPDGESWEARVVPHEGGWALDEGVGQGYDGEVWRAVHPWWSAAVHRQPSLRHLHLGGIHERLPGWNLLCC